MQHPSMTFHTSHTSTIRETDTTSSREPDEAQKVLRDDLFDEVQSDAELEAIVARFSLVTHSPYAEVLKRMLGLDDVEEKEAKALFRCVVEHRRHLERALGRAMHIRVAGLDFLTLDGYGRLNERTKERDSRPIVVTTSLIERALEEASSDALTGLPQRAHFLNLVRHELRQRHRRNFVVAFVDLDGFKEVNDTYGHARGDDVLRVLAEAAKVTLRAGDVIARMGGDEFAIMLLDVNEEEASAIIDRLRARFEARTERFGTSFSCGVVLDEPGDTAEAILVRADAKMYQDKRDRAHRRPVR